MSSPSPLYSFVIPVYNEQETLPELQRRMVELMNALDAPAEAILINDGSSDQSQQLMQSIADADRRFKVLKFSRNFGHQIAISAGIDFSSGQAVVILDADLQDPPEVIHEMIAQWKQGYQVVYAVRKERKGETFFKKASASLFYRFLRKFTEVDIPADVGDFRLVDRQAVNAFKSLRENNRYVRGLFSWIGFRQTAVNYVRAERFAGETKYPLRKMLQFAMNGVLSFSNVPLKLALHLGFLVSCSAFLYGLFAILAKLAGWYTVRGWASILVVVSFLGGIQLIVLGVIGQYIGRIYDEVKRRPIYIIESAQGFEAAPLVNSTNLPSSL